MNANDGQLTNEANIIIQIENLRMLVKQLHEDSKTMQLDFSILKEEYVDEKKRLTLLHKRMLNFMPEAIERQGRGGNSLSM